MEGGYKIMGKTVDERVVSMQFDNKQFEQETKRTMSTLDKLKEKLKFKDSGKDLEDLNKSIKKVDFKPMEKSIETVKAKFSALEVAAATVVHNITNSMYNAAKRTLSAFTIDPVKTGFSEYEQKMGSVQTIMASTGESLETVNKYLEELNKYSDQTIYSFSDMTQNIGKFTNAGVKLDDAVMAIKGISNEAALSGANANEASRAMYNFAQALSSGAVKLIDWKSIENANMATVQFKEQLLESALAMGTVVKVGDKYQTTTTNANGDVSELFTTTSMFNESLAHQWMTTDVLVKTLKGYADANTDIGKKAYAAAQDVKTFSMMMDTLKESAQSGWAQTWEILIGDFETAKKLWTNVTNFFGNIIGKMSDRRNALLKGALGEQGVGAWDAIIKKVNEVGISTSAFEERIKETAKEHGYSVDELIKNHKSLANCFKEGKLPVSIIVETFKKYADGAGKASAETAEMMDKLAHFQDLFDRIWHGEFGNGQERINKMTAAGYDYATAQQLVNKAYEKGHILGYKLTMEDLAEVINNLSVAELKNIGYTEEQAKAMKALAEEAEKTGTPMAELLESLTKPSGRFLLFDSLKNIGTAFSRVFSSIKKAWSEVFKPLTSSDLYDVIDAFHKFTQALVMSEDTADKLYRTFKGVFSILHLGASIVKTVLVVALKTLGNILGVVGDDVLDVTAYIGDALTKFSEWITTNKFLVKGVEFVVKVVTKLVKTIYEITKAFFQLPGVQKAMGKIKEVAKDVGLAIRDYFAEGIERIKEFLERTKQLEGGFTFENVKKVLKDFYENVFKYFFNFGAITDWFKSFFGMLKDIFTKGFTAVSGWFVDNFSGVFDVAKNAFMKGFGKIIDVFNWVKERLTDFSKFLSTMTMSDLVNILFSVSALKALKVMLDTLKMISGMFKSLSGMFDSIGGFFDGLKFKAKTKGILVLAIAIGVLAASVFLLTKIETKKMWGAVGALAALISAMGLLVFAVSKIKDFKDIGKTGALLLGIGVACFLLVKSLDTLLGMDMGDALKGVGILALLLTALKSVVVGMVYYSKEGKAAAKGALTFIGIALACRMLVNLLEDMQSMNLKGTAGSLLLLVTLMAAIALVAKACNGVKMGSAFTIITLVLALKMILGVVKDIAAMDHKAIKDSLGIIAGIFASLSMVLVAAKFAGANAGKAGKLILSTSIGLLIIAGVMKILAGMDKEGLKQAGIVVGALMGIFTALVGVSYFAGEHADKAGKMLLSMAGAMVVITALLWVIKKMDQEGLGRAMAAVTTIGLMFAVLISSTKNAQKASGMIIVLTVAMSAMVGLVYLLTKLDKNKVTVATACLTAIMGMFAVFMKVVTGITQYRGTSKKLVTILGSLLLVVGGLALILAGLSLLDPTGMPLIAASLSALIIALSGAVFILSKTGNNRKTALRAAYGLLGVVAAFAVILGVMSALKVGASIETASALSELIIALSAACLVLSNAKTISGKAIGAAYAMAGVVAVLSLVFLLIDKLNISASMETATALSTLLIAMSVACGIVSLIPASGAISGTVGLAAFIAGMAVILTALGALTKIPGFSEIIESGGEILGKIGYALGNFVGSIVGGALAGLSSALPAIGKNLSEFIANLNPFTAGLKQLTPELLKGAVLLAEMLLIIAGASILNTINRWLGNADPMKTFVVQILAFGAGIVEFSKMVKGNIDEKSVLAAANAGKMLAEMAKTIPKSCGLVQAIIGETDYGAFLNFLPSFGEKIAAFSKTVKGKIDASAVESAANAGKMMSELVDTLPRTGGVAQVFTGETDYWGFLNFLPKFGTKMTEFSSKVKGKIDESAVESAANAGKMMSSLVDTLPKTGGIAQVFTGETDYTGFLNFLPKFGAKMTEFSKTVAGKIDEKAVGAASSAGEMIATLVEKLPKTDGVVQWWNGETDMDGFVAFVSELGPAMKQFSTDVDGLNPDNVKAAADAATAMAALFEVIDDCETLSKAKEKIAPEMGGILEEIASTLAASLNGFADSVSKIDATKLDSALKAAEAITTMAGKELVEHNIFHNLGTETFKEKSKALGEGIANFYNATKDIDNFDNLGSGISAMGSIIDALNSVQTRVSQSGTSISDFSLYVDDVNEMGTSLADLRDLLAERSFTETDATNIQNFSKAAVAITDMMNKLTAPKEDKNFWTIMSDCLGIKDEEFNIEDFSSNLTTFGNAMSSFGTSVAGLNTEAVTTASTVGTQIVDMMTKIFGSEVLTKYQLTDKMATFSSRMTSLGNGISSFANSVAGIDVTATSTAATASEGIVDALNTLLDPNSAFMTCKDPVGELSELRSSMAQLGQAIANFKNWAGNTSDLSGSVTHIQTIVDIVDKLMGINTDTMSTMATKLGDVTTSLSTFVNAMNGLNVVDLSDKVTAINDALKKLNESGDVEVNTLANSFKESQSALETTIGTVLEAAVTKIKSKDSKFEEAGKDLAKALNSGVETLGDGKETSVSSAFTGALDSALTAISNKVGSFRTSGGNVVDGFVDGINSGLFRVRFAASNMGNEAIRSFNKSVDINSPSKEFYKSGAFCGIGTVNALEDYADKVGAAGYNMGESAKSGLSRAIAKVSSVIENGVDAQPTIRPVLDLSDVTDGANRINGLFGMTPSVGLLNNVGAISSSMNRRIQNGGNSDVVSAIKDLKDSVGKNSGNSYTIGGITYNKGTDVAEAVETLVRAITVEGRM
jgi:hypothetical protein